MGEETSSKTGGLSPQYRSYERQKCFVAHSHEARWRDDILSTCDQVLPEFGLEPWYAADHFDPIRSLRDKMVELIANTRYGIYDLSYWRKESKSDWVMPRNVFIELGVAIALNRPTLLLRHTENRVSGLKLPMCLESISEYVLEFSGSTTLQRILREHLAHWANTPPEREWWNRYCLFGNRICEYREAYPHGRQWGQETIRCHISDGQDTDRPDFRGVVEEVLGRFSDVAFEYLDGLSMVDGYDFLLCTHCQRVRSTPFAIYRITPQTPAETFLAIGMSLALEAQFTHRIPKILLTTSTREIPSLLSGYEVVEAHNDQECKTYLRKFLPAVIQEVRKTTWRPRPLPFIEVVPRQVEKPAANQLGADAQPDSDEKSVAPEQGEGSYIGKVGKYGLIREIGRGSFATVYLARDIESQHVYAVKIMHSELSQDSELLTRFHREASILKRLDDPHIVQMVDYGNDNNVPFIVMDYIDGQNLKYHILTNGPMEPLRALGYTRQIAEGLDAAYKQSVVHRNIKPQDILVNAEDIVKIVDFGLARTHDMPAITQENVFLGTAYYIAPEQAESGRSADTRSDLYSLAVVLFEMLTGSPPFSGENVVDIVIKHIQERVPSISSLRPDLPVEIDAFFEKAMAKPPAGRYQTPLEFIAALDQLQQRIQVVPTSQRTPNLGDEQVMQSNTTTVPQVATDADLNFLVGKSLGQYRMVERISAGYMGGVFKAYDPHLDRYVAVKVLPAYHARDPIFLKRFMQEARSLAKLQHANIVPIHEFGEQDGITYIVMEYVVGGTLKGRLKGQAIPVEQSVDFIIQAASGLAYAHRNGIVHCDVKPANMLLRKDGHLLISNFGITKILEGMTNLTRAGTGIGTPQYMSPEQGTGQPVDHHSDIYSLGIVLFECLTGHVPFTADSPLTIIVKHLNNPLPVEHLRAIGVPQPIEQVLLKMTAKAPADRYQTMEDVINALTVASNSAMPYRQYISPSASPYRESSRRDTKERTCFRCGTVNQGGRQFCTICSYDLSDPHADADYYLGPDGRPVLARLSFQAGPLAGRSYRFHQVQTTIGRTNDNDLVIPDKITSRHHARLWFDNGQWYLEDLQSANGTRVNDVQIHGPTRLNDGDIIRLGQETVVFNIAYQ
jgi:serine/threonine protein kinase